MSWVYVPLVNYRAVFLVQFQSSHSHKVYHGSYFTLCPVSLFLQYGIMQCGPGGYISVSQVISDDVPAEGAVVIESSIKHDVACSSETVRQLV